MSDPRRLHEDANVPEFDRALLQAARLDREPEDGAARALLALGVGAGASAVIAGEGSAAPAAAKGASVTGMLGGSAVVKGVVGLALLSGIVLALRLATTPAGSPPTRLQAIEPAPTPVPLAAPFVEPQARVETAPPPPVAEATIAVVDLPSAAKVTVTARSATSTPAASPVHVEPKAEAKEPSVSEEIALIDRARTALAAGDPGAAERALDDHDARFESGMLALESKVARIELLVGRGDSNGARALAERFLAEHPRSAYENRVRGLLRRLDNLNSNLDSNSR